MNARTIMSFPEYSNIYIVHYFGNEFDPLAEQVLLKITLVFPS
jgi:hypothetical protein